MEDLDLQLNAGSRVAVVGAGWSGLAAAVELAGAGCRVSVLEAARQPGGRARSLNLDGDALDNGQHLLSGAYRETLGLMRRVGADPDRLLLRLPLEVLVPGHFRLRLPRLPAPLHLAAGLFAARGPDLADKLRATRFMRRLQADRYRLGSDCSVADWLDAAGQHGALRRHLWDALCLAALNTPPAVASAQVFANVLRDTLGGPREATDLLLPRADLGRLLPQPALAWLRAQGAEIRLSARVAALTPQADGIRVDSAGGSENFAAVIVACAPQHAAALLPEGCAATVASLRDFRYEPICTVYTQYPEQVALPLPLLLLADAPAQWVFDRGQLGNRRGLLAHVLSASGPWQQLANEDLAERLHAALLRSLPQLPPPLGSRVIREQRATFACRPDLRRPPHRTPFPRLRLAGDYTAGDYPATIEGAVRSGLAAARGLLGRA